MLVRAGLGAPEPGSARSLPDDLVGAAAQRVGSAGLLYSAGWVGSNLAGWLSDPEDWPIEEVPWLLLSRGVLIAISSVLVGLVVWAVVRSGRLEARTILRIGLGFYVLGAFGIALGTEGFPRPLVDVTWVSVWIIAYATVVPDRPIVALLASVAAAFTSPAAVAVNAAVGHRPPVEVGEALATSIPNLVCAGLAYACARIVYGLGAQVREARELGAYRLVDKLGEGGMGQVWRAEHRMLARPAAIKLIRPGALEVDAGRAQTVVRRFEREAQTTARLSSPHTVDLFDFGVADDGTFYYVMELLSGVSLEELVRRHGPAPAERVVHILVHACNSLADAHANGLVHRDIKPANLFLCRRGIEFDFVKVLDFGLVTTLAEMEGYHTRLTRDGVVTGTPAYMAPELASGDTEIGPAADLYSLGCVAYWLLTGELVFDADTPMRTILDHVNTPPVAPSERTEVEIPPALEAAVLRCLAKQPRERFASAAALAGALAGLPLEPWSQERAARWWALHMPKE